MILIGLTGGIATGKSTAVDILRRDHHCIIVDCDEIVRELQCKGSSAVRAIQRVWPEVVTPTGELDRSKLSNIVFSDAKARRRLAGIMNWRIVVAVVRRLYAHWWSSRRGDVVILDAPILFETNLFTKLIAASVVVSCSRSMQLERLMARGEGMEMVDAVKRVDAQMPLAEKEKRADAVLTNAGSMQELRSEVARVVQWMKKQSPDTFTLRMVVLPVTVVAVVAIALGARLF